MGEQAKRGKMVVGDIAGAARAKGDHFVGAGKMGVAGIGADATMDGAHLVAALDW